jgi:hypothetical protein
VFLPALLGVALLASLWFAGHRLPSADEGALLVNAMKLTRGGIFYRDVDAYPFPLATYLLAGWMSRFGEDLAVSRGLATLFFCAALAALYAAALRVLDARRAALFGLALLSFKVVAWPSFTAYAYPDVAFAFGCVCVALLLRHRFEGGVGLPAAAGACAGLALLAKQSLGIYLAAAAAACLLLAGPLLGVRRAAPRAAWRETLAFGAGAAAPVALGAVYFAWHGLLGTALESGLVRPFTAYLPSSGIGFSPPLLWWRFGALREREAIPYFAHAVWTLLLLGRPPGTSAHPALWASAEALFRALYTSVPLAFAGAAALWVRARRAGRLARERETLLLAVLAGAVLLSAFPRADWPHVSGVYPLVLLLLFALWGRLGAADARRQRALRAAEAVGVAALLAGSAAVAALDHARLSQRVQLERADVWVRPEDGWLQSLVRYVEEEVPAGEPIFVFGQDADLYFLTGRLFDWPFSQLYPGQTGGAGGAELLARIEARRPKLVLRGLMNWPGLPSLETYVPRVDRWVRTSCERVPDVFERFPPPSGEPPFWWWLSVLRPCEPGAPCQPFEKFMEHAPVPW